MLTEVLDLCTESGFLINSGDEFGFIEVKTSALAEVARNLLTYKGFFNVSK